MAGEKRFENQVKRWLESKGIYPFGTPKDKMPVPPIGYWEKRWGGGQFTKSGLPDMHIAVNGYNIDLEIKDIKGKPSELQKFMINQINDCKCNGFIVYPKDFEDLKAFIEDLIRGR